MAQQQTPTATTATTTTMPVPPEMAGLPPYEPLNSNEILSLGSRDGWWFNDILRRSTEIAGTPANAIGTPERAALLMEYYARDEIDELGWEGQWADWSYVGWHIAAFHARNPRRATPKAGEA